MPTWRAWPRWGAWSVWICAAERSAGGRPSTRAPVATNRRNRSSRRKRAKRRRALGDRCPGGLSSGLVLTGLHLRWHAPHIGGAKGLAAGLLFVLVLGGIAGPAYVDHARRRAAEQRRVDLACLAENVYFEARGEPLVGQYAVAEVTMNRVASPLFPSTVCGVVHARRFDPIRKRYVGAFSWTELDKLEPPHGEEWLRADTVASAVYDNPDESPLVDGALFYHATRISPAWAKTKTRIARIGRHLFYE